MKNRTPKHPTQAEPTRIPVRLEIRHSSSARRSCFACGGQVEEETYLVYVRADVPPLIEIDWPLCDRCVERAADALVQRPHDVQKKASVFARLVIDGSCPSLADLKRARLADDDEAPPLRSRDEPHKPTGRRKGPGKDAKVNSTLGKKKATVSNGQLNRLAKSARTSSSSNRKSSDGSR